MQDKQRIRGFFAHASIIIGMMFIVFFVIDQFNPAMEFLTSSLSKWLIFVLAVCALFTCLFSAVFLFQKQKRRDEKRSHPQTRPAFEETSVPQERFVQRYNDPRAYPQARQSKEYVSQPLYQPAPSRQTNGRPQDYPRYTGEQSKSDYERRDTYNR